MFKDLNREASDKLETLLHTSPSSLTEADIEFLRARSSYLSEGQKDMLKQFDTARKEEAKADAEDAKTKAKDAKAEDKELKK